MFQSEIDQEFDILQQSISHQEEENPEKECLIGTNAEEQCQQQPHQGFIEDFIKLSEGLS